MQSLAEGIADTAARRAAAVALEFDGVEQSFGALADTAARQAAVLHALGVRAGDRVAVGLPNSPELVTTVLAVLHTGAVLVPLNPAAAPDEVTYLVSDAGARVAIVGDRHASALRADRPNTLTHVLGAIVPGTAAPAGVVPTGPEAPALIIYTSGTTGRPKGAVLSNRALLSNLLTVANAWRWSPDDRLLLTLPCFHLHGLGLGILTSLLRGSRIALRRRFVAEATLADLAQSEATMFFGVPTMYNRLVTLPAASWQTARLNRMRLWVSGSAPLSAATFERFQACSGFALMDRYGMTECGFVLATPYDEPRRPGVVGRALPGIVVRLVDPDTADRGTLVDVADGEQGEIVIRGPNLFSGYWQRPQETQHAFLDGYLRSGDLAIREADGMLRIVGRSSVDIIKTRGFKVSAVEIEDCLQRCPGVAEVAVVGLPDADQGERVVAAVTPRADAQLTAETVRAFARVHLAPHKVPSHVDFIEEIPRVGPGKFQKKALIRHLIALQEPSR